MKHKSITYVDTVATLRNSKIFYRFVIKGDVLFIGIKHVREAKYILSPPRYVPDLVEKTNSLDFAKLAQKIVDNNCFDNIHKLTLVELINLSL